MNTISIKSVTRIGEMLRQSVLESEKLVWAVSHITVRGIEKVKYELEYLAKRSGIIEIYVTTDHGVTSPNALSILLEISKFSDSFVLRNIEKINFRAKVYYFRLKNGRLRILSGSHDLSGSIDEANNHSFVLEGSAGDLRVAFGITKGEDILPSIFPEWKDWMKHSVPWTLKKNRNYISQRTETGRRIEKELDEGGSAEFTWSNDVKKGYKKRRDVLKDVFPEGYRFLLNLEQLHDRDSRFHIGTDRNLQMYFENTFLFHLKIVNRQSTGPQLIFSPQFHGHLKEGTHPNPALFFSRISRQREIFDTKHRGSSKSESITVKPGDREAFFKQASGILGSLMEMR